ncbi:MAG: ATP-binding protein, partial [Woeseiaceae bacterium]
MGFNGDVLLQRLGELQCGVAVDRYLVGFSGGLDSTVLLHALARTRAAHGIPVVAVHINHALHADAEAWERHCHRFADDLGAAYISRDVAV